MVTIIVPTYNRHKELKERSLPSIFKQTYKDWELIIVNDGGGIINNVKDATVINLAENKGKSYCVNLAVSKAKGEYIVVVDDDNEICSQFLELAVKAMEEESAKQVGFGNSHYHAVTTGRVVKHLGYNDYAPAFFQTGYGFSAIDWGWLIRKEVFDEIKYDEGLMGDEDADLGIQFFKRFRAYPLDLPLQVAYAEGDGVSFPSEKRLDSLIKFYDKNWREYEQSGPADISFLNRFVARNLYLAGKKRQAIRYFWRTFRSWPCRRTLTHFLVSLISYKAYYILMRTEEKYYSRKRLKAYKL